MKISLIHSRRNDDLMYYYDAGLQLHKGSFYWIPGNNIAPSRVPKFSEI